MDHAEELVGLGIRTVEMSARQGTVSDYSATSNWRADSAVSTKPALLLQIRFTCTIMKALKDAKSSQTNRN